MSVGRAARTTGRTTRKDLWSVAAWIEVSANQTMSMSSAETMHRVADFLRREASNRYIRGIARRNGISTASAAQWVDEQEKR